MLFNPLFQTEKYNRIGFRLGMVALALSIGLRIAGMVNGYANAYWRTPVSIFGIYEVDSFAVNGDVLGAYGINRGFAVLYEDGDRILRQNFRESGDVARTNGKPKSLSSKQLSLIHI